VAEGSRSNLHRTRLFRDEVLAELHAHRVFDAGRPSGTRSADIYGLPFYVTCRAQESLRMAETQDEAELSAREAKKELWAAVVRRRDADLRHAYTVMPLYVFAAVLRTLTVDAMVRNDLDHASLLR
jgi:hypothetical protein